MSSGYKIHNNDGIYFITSTIVEWIPIFTNIAYLNMLVDSITYCQQNKGLEVYAYVLMDNHFHLIARAPALSKVMQSLKRHTAKQVMNMLKSDSRQWITDLLTLFKLKYKLESSHQLWQEGFHPKQILFGDMMKQKVKYIHNNPVKRGYVIKPEHWTYSSAGDYILGKRGPIELYELECL